MTSISYTFTSVENCEMCGSDISEHKIIGQRLNQPQGLRPKRKSGIAVSIQKCGKCGLVYSNPQPVPANIQDHYGMPPEEYWTDQQRNDRADYFAGELHVAQQLLEFREGMKALDIGSGFGRAFMALQSAGFDVWGLEPSEPFYRNLIDRRGIPEDRVKNAMVEDCNYESEIFDFITFSAVFEHLYHPALALEKALGWLKRGGIVHIEVPNSEYLMTRLFNNYFKFTGTNYVSHISPMHNPYHLYEFTPRSFEALGKKLGFEIAYLDVYVGDIYYVPSIMHSTLKQIMKRTKTGMQIAVYLRKN